MQRRSRCILQPQPTEKYTELNVKTVLFQIIEFIISIQFRRQNSSISSSSVYHEYAVYLLKQFYYKQFSLAWARNFDAKNSTSRKPGLVLFNPYIEHLSVWRCPWCNCYRRRKWTRRHEFKSWTRLTAFHIALISLGKVWIQLFSLQLWVNSRTDSVFQPWLDN